MSRDLLVWSVSVAAAFALVHWHDLELVAAPFIALAVTAALPSLWFAARRREATKASVRPIRDDATIRVIVA